MSGCSSGGASLSKAEFIQQADSICTSLNDRSQSLDVPAFDPSTATTAEMPEAAAYFDDLLPIARDGVRQLHDLGSPDQDGDVADRWLATVDDEVAAFEDMADSAHAGDAVGFAAAFDSASRSDSESSMLAEEFGFQVCGVG